MRSNLANGLIKEKRKTAGELSLKAASDSTRYDPLEIAHALTDDVYEQLCICAQRHLPIIAEDEFFIVLIVAGDPLLTNLQRHKYCALIHLPQPRPQQSVFLYNRHTNKFKRLWSMPDAKTMAVIDEMPYVDRKWQDTKRWVRSFYNKTFFEDIRQEHGIKHLSEKEYLDLHHDELIKSGVNDPSSSLTNAFDFSKIMAPTLAKFEKIEDSDVTFKD
jgi:hypothetical protein